MIRGRQSLLSSGVISLAASLWSGALAFITVPIMVRGLGLGAYGVYTLAFSVTAFGSYLDFGLGWTTSKFVAEADGIGTEVAVSATLAAAAAYQAAVGLLFALVVFPFANQIAHSVLHSSGNDALTMGRAIQVAVVAFFLSSLMGVFVSCLRGLRRFAVATLIASTALTISIAGAATAAKHGLGVVTATWAQVVGSGCGLAMGVYVCWPYLLQPPLLASIRCELRKMLGFSIWSYLTRLSQIVILDCDSLLMGRFAGAAFLPFYTVPLGLAQRINMLGGPAVTAIYPTASLGQFDKERFLKQYSAASRLLHVLTAAGAITLLLFGHRFLAAWVGPQMAEQGAFFLYITASGFWVISVGSLDAGCLEGWNHPRMTFGIMAASATLAAITALTSAHWVGAAKAIAVAVGLFLSLAGVAQMVAWRRVSGQSAAEFIRRTLVPVLELATVGVIAALVFRPFVYSLKMVVGVMVIMTLVLAVFGIFRAFDADERSGLLRRIVPRLGSRVHCRSEVSSQRECDEVAVRRGRPAV